MSYIKIIISDTGGLILMRHYISLVGPMQHLQ